MYTAAQAIKQAEAILAANPPPSEDQDLRWSAIIRVAEFAETEPDALWLFARRWGSSRDADLRDAIASCLLEHLLEFHFSYLFPKVEAAAREDPLFADTFLGCWEFGQTGEPANAARFHTLQRELAQAAGNRHKSRR